MALAHVVAAKRERAFAGIPSGENKIADQMLDAIRAPFSVGGEQQRAVRHVAQRIGTDR